jgi:hypothetical protein
MNNANAKAPTKKDANATIKIRPSLPRDESHAGATEAMPPSRGSIFESLQRHTLNHL